MEEMVPLSGEHYKKMEKKDRRNVLTSYPGIFDEHLAHGWLGDIYLLWTVALGLLALAMVSTGVQVGYLAILIPSSIEAFVVVVGAVWLSYLIMRADKSSKVIIRDGTKQTLSYETLKKAVFSAYNANADYSLFVRGCVWTTIQLTLTIIYATTVTVSPNLVEGAPATILNYNQGLLENFKNPIKPLENGGVDVIYILVVIMLLKSADLVAQFFDRTNVQLLRGKIHKINRAIDVDEQGKKGESSMSTRKGTAASALFAVNTGA